MLSDALARIIHHLWQNGGVWQFGRVSGEGEGLVWLADAQSPLPPNRVGRGGDVARDGVDDYPLPEPVAKEKARTVCAICR